MDVLTTKELSPIWGISPQRIRRLCAEGKINGAYKIGTSWVIPAGTEKPPDARVTSGKWVGYKRPKKQNGGRGND